MRVEQKKRFETVADYLDKHDCSSFFDNGEVKKIAKACGIFAPEARAGLRKCGYEKITNRHGIAQWVRKR